MPVTLQATCFYNLRLGDQRMHRLLTATTKEAATEMGLLDRIKDWFCSGKKKNCLNLMYDLLTNIETFKAEHPEKLEELRSLFRHADVRDLIHFWHAHDENGQSLLGRAVLINDEASRATIKRCLAVLECFPLERFRRVHWRP